MKKYSSTAPNEFSNFNEINERATEKLHVTFFESEGKSLSSLKSALVKRNRVADISDNN